MKKRKRATQCRAIRIRKSHLIADVLRLCAAVLAGEDHPSLEVAVIAEVFKGGGHIVIDYKKVPPPQPTEAPARPADRTTRELTPRQIRKIQRAMGWVPSRSDLDALVSGWHPHKTR